MSVPSGGQNRLPLVIGSGAVVVAAIVAIALGVNSASAPLPAQPTPTPVVPTPTPTPTPTAAPTIAFADCSKVKFGAVLQPLNPPASVHTYSAAPAMTIDTTKLYQATIATSRGDIVLCLQPDLAPITRQQLRHARQEPLLRRHSVPSCRVRLRHPGWRPAVHRAVPAAPATPSGTCGQGGPGFEFNDEPVHQQYVEGALAMANSGTATRNGSQFFICIADDSSTLTPSYNLFGKVESGMDVALKIVQGDVMKSITVREQT